MKKFSFTIEGNKYEVLVHPVKGNTATVEINGKTLTVDIEAEEKSQPAPILRRQVGGSAPIASSAPAQVLPSDAANIKAQLPGSIVKVVAKPGQVVKRGDVLLVMESMKMENNICAEADGKVKTIRVQAGQTVMQGDDLVEMEVLAPAQPVSSPKAAPKAESPKSAPKTKAGKEAVLAQLPGSIVKVLVSAGQTVKRGDVLLVMESMKMENNIMAERDCTVKAVLVQAGQTVMQGDALVDIE